MAEIIEASVVIPDWSYGLPYFCSTIVSSVAMRLLSLCCRTQLADIVLYVLLHPVLYSVFKSCAVIIISTVE